MGQSEKRCIRWPIVAYLHFIFFPFKQRANSPRGVARSRCAHKLKKEKIEREREKRKKKKRMKTRWTSECNTRLWELLRAAWNVLLLIFPSLSPLFPCFLARSSAQSDPACSMIRIEKDRNRYTCCCESSATTVLAKELFIERLIGHGTSERV